MCIHCIYNSAFCLDIFFILGEETECVAPNICKYKPGYTGSDCQTD